MPDRWSISIVFAATAAQGITLDAALQRTIENNPQIRQAKAQLEAAAGRRLVFRARTLPDARTNVPVGLQGGHRSGQKNVQPFAFDNFAVGQPLFDAAINPSIRRADLEVLLEPYWIFPASGAIHGTTFGYDTHVQVIFMGKGIRPGRYYQNILVNDVAPTLAAILEVETPSGSVGRPSRNCCRSISPPAVNGRPTTWQST